MRVIDTKRIACKMSLEVEHMRKNLKDRRKALGLTQRDIAIRLNVSRACYANYENGIREPSMSKGSEIKKILQTNDDSIFFNVL